MESAAWVDEDLSLTPARRRWSWVLLAVVVALVAAIVVARWVWFPQHRPALREASVTASMCRNTRA